MLTLLLADAELERMPPQLTGHAQVQETARRFGQNASRMLLDSSLHYAALRALPDSNRRGRPDLVHLFLLTCLESILNRAGRLRTLVHTREDLLLRVQSHTRIQRNYSRFCGLIEQLFETGKVPPDEPLLTLERQRPLDGVLAELAPDRVLIFDEAGTPRAPGGVFGPADADRNLVAIVGGFPHGTYRSPLPAGDRISLFPEPLSVWTVAAELLSHYAHVSGVSGPASGAKSK